MSTVPKHALECLTLPTGAAYSRSMQELANALKKARRDRGLTQAEAAKQAGVSPRSWTNYERGLSKPFEVTLGNIERWLAA